MSEVRRVTVPSPDEQRKLLDRLFDTVEYAGAADLPRDEHGVVLDPDGDEDDD